MINIINKLEQKKEPLPIEDLCASFRKSVIEHLTTNFFKAAAHLKYKNLAICGGVSANSLLRKYLEEECLKRGYNFFKPLKNLCGDNAAMVGSQAYYEFLNGKVGNLDLNAYASMNVEKEI